MGTRYGSVDDYIQACPEHVRGRLEEMRRTIRKAVPDATEVIAYQIPTSRLRGRNLVHFAAFREHVGFYPTASGTEAFSEELAPHSTSKGTVRFPLDQPIPHDLVSRIVAFRVKEVLAGKR